MRHKLTRCDMEHFLACHLAAFDALGIPEQVLYDNLKTGILGRRPDGTPILPGRFLDFALYYGFIPRYCQPYRPRTKGKVERGVSYVRQNFWVRVQQEVESGQMDLATLNERVQSWTAEVAHQRVHGTHGVVVAERFAEELPLLGHLDARPRYDTSYQAVRRVGRDGRLSYRGQLYQVSLRYILTEVEVRESLQGTVTVRALDGTPILAVVVDQPLQRSRLEQAHPDGGDQNPVLLASPVVEQRDLAAYEEVARVASHG